VVPVVTSSLGNNSIPFMAIAAFGESVSMQNYSPFHEETLLLNDNFIYIYI
jgi:hypothetical protein